MAYGNSRLVLTEVSMLMALELWMEWLSVCRLFHALGAAAQKACSMELTQ